MSPDEPEGQVTQPFQNWFAFENCGQAQIARLERAGQILSDRIYEDRTTSFTSCIADAFISETRGAAWSLEIAGNFQRAAQTRVRCTNNLAEECDGTHDFWACASVGITGERLTIANQLLNDPRQSDAVVAGVLAHELAHNYGYRHSATAFTAGYEHSVPAVVQSCVQLNNRLPSATPGEAVSRTNGIGGETILGPVGKLGGYSGEFDCGRDFISGVRVKAGDRVDSLRATCDSGRTSNWFGYVPDASVARTCAAGQVVIGVAGRAMDRLDRLQLICGDPSHATVNYLSADGGSGGRVFESRCPVGKAVRRLMVRSMTGIDQLQLVCDAVAEQTPHAPRAAFSSNTTSLGTMHYQRCSGNGVITALTGKAGARVDQLFGLCRVTTTTPSFQTGTPEHPLVPIVGGWGGTDFNMPCPAGEGLVGLRMRTGSRLDAIGPICAPLQVWAATGTGSRDVGALSGGSGGTLGRYMCPGREFLVGMNVAGGAEVERVDGVCRRLLP
jgi:hypothetical protein